jgi:hypothetical protein
MGSKRHRGLFDYEDRMREIGAKDPLARLHVTERFGDIPRDQSKQH